jgi:hypothetical protein
MNKEILRMQILAGIITEGQYKRLLEDEETINYILDKISTQGKDSLTPAEKTYLDNYSKGKKDLEKPYINNNIPEDLKEFLYDMVDQHLPEDAEDRDIIEFIWEDEEFGDEDSYGEYAQMFKDAHKYISKNGGKITVTFEDYPSITFISLKKGDIKVTTSIKLKDFNPDDFSDYFGSINPSES